MFAGMRQLTPLDLRPWLTTLCFCARITRNYESVTQTHVTANSGSWREFYFNFSHISNGLDHYIHCLCTAQNPNFTVYVKLWSIRTEMKSPQLVRTALDREHFLITDKQTEILGCIPCVMVIFRSTHKWTDGWMDGRMLPNVLSPLLRGW